ncbi:MAG: L,D-transpeptidase family protein [Alphaproteobacteria bacterium]
MTHSDLPWTRRAILAGLASTLASAAAPSLALAAPGATRAPARNDMVGELRVYSARYEDTLMDVAREFNLGYAELIAANPGVDPWLPGLGTRILLPTAHVLPDAPRHGIVVNLSDQRIYWFPPGGGIQTFAIGIGQEGLNTPSGSTTVVRKRERPTWIPTAEKRREDPSLPAIVPAGPDNPMGDYALYLGWPLYAIHGTNEPDAIGRRVTRGCIRLYPEGIEALFRMVPVGTRVTVVDQEAKIGWVGDDLYVDLHPTRRDVDMLEEEGTFDPKPIAGLRDRVARVAGTAIGRIDWATVDAAERQRNGVPVRVTRSIDAPRETVPSREDLPIERVSRS